MYVTLNVLGKLSRKEKQDICIFLICLGRPRKNYFVKLNAD